MGHSLSLGDCDLATVVSHDAALADAVATMTCNKIKDEADIERALAYAASLEGVRGVLIFRDEKIGMAGDGIPLVRL